VATGASNDLASKHWPTAAASGCSSGDDDDDDEGSGSSGGDSDGSGGSSSDCDSEGELEPSAPEVVVSHKNGRPPHLTRQPARPAPLH
jgi:hypothetical protein